MSQIFKAYDIRGIYGDTLTEDLARDIGRAFASFLKCRKVVVGQDMRPHSQPLFDALAAGLTMQGCDVIHLGLCSTPMSYYANGLLGTDAGIMITASHNPGEWNGFKLSRAQAVPISGDTGIKDIERIVKEKSFDAPAETPGGITEYDVIPSYVEHVREHVHFGRQVRIAADMANSMGVYEAKVLEGIMDIEPMFDELDGTFPNHEANPLNLDTLEPLQEKVRSGTYDFGIAFDGDADRAGFVDEKGDIIPMDIITALVAEDILAQQKGVIFYDLRSSWAVKEIIEENGGTPMMSRVGHAFIKQQMRDSDAVFAGELSGHYYFRDNYFTESSSMAAICVANIITNSDKPLSELVAPIVRYSASGEINSTVEDSAVVLDRIREGYADGTVLELDGVSVEYDDWWFNVRCSNTEPLVRLNVEAKTREMMEKKRDELLALIRA
ncbi:MAG: phosphomannomutase/phosphoglucomutase [Kiritimatiellia bacterium]|jgi:phosphomannomutase|nr:phosphomannomutase/phosphoglucomutase [Kiritimatiellia bacterium]